MREQPSPWMHPLYGAPPPPKKRSRARRIALICLSVAVTLALILIVVALATPKVPTTGGTLSATTATSSPSHTDTHASIGSVVTSGSWQVTVNKVSTSQGDSQFNTPKPGNLYLDVDVTLKNTDSATQTASSLVMWTLRDAKGNTYQENIVANNAPDGDVVSGQPLHGVVEYEVPKSVRAFTLQFDPSFDASQVATWQIHD